MEGLIYNVLVMHGGVYSVLFGIICVIVLLAVMGIDEAQAVVGVLIIVAIAVGFIAFAYAFPTAAIIALLAAILAGMLTR